jgi:hypothetical protein
MTISKVTSIVPTGKEPFASAHGLLYEFKMAFADGVSGFVNAKSATGPAYKVGDMVGYEITGDYKGVSKIKVDKKAANNFASPDHSHGTGGRPTETAPVGEDVQGQRFRGPEGNFPINGATVGMAMNNALTLLTSGLDHDEVVMRLCEKSFWLAVRETSSDIIRVAQNLESGHLAKSVTERTAGPATSSDRVVAPVRTAPPQTAEFGPDEDVPF